MTEVTRGSAGKQAFFYAENFKGTIQGGLFQLLYFFTCSLHIFLLGPLFDATSFLSPRSTIFRAQDSELAVLTGIATARGRPCGIPSGKREGSALSPLLLSFASSFPSLPSSSS